MASSDRIEATASPRYLTSCGVIGLGLWGHICFWPTQPPCDIFSRRESSFKWGQKHVRRDVRTGLAKMWFLMPLPQSTDGHFS